MVLLRTGSRGQTGALAMHLPRMRLLEIGVSPYTWNLHAATPSLSASITVEIDYHAPGRITPPAFLTVGSGQTLTVTLVALM